MKSDLDSLMRSSNAEALLVVGSTHHNPSMYYFAGDASLLEGTLVKKCGEPPILFHHPMERDEAARTGLRTVDSGIYPLKDLLEQAGGDFIEAQARRCLLMLKEANIDHGRVLIYGQEEIGPLWAVLSRLQRLAPQIELVGELSDSLLLRAMATKDLIEVERIRKMGRVTVAVVDRVAQLLRHAPVKDTVLLAETGQPLTIKDVKRRIDLWLAECGAENPEGTIFSLGRDAGVPHSAGNPDEPLRQGQTIVFDIFPCEAGGGYFYDFTRTWCIGYAPAEIQQIYDDVYSTFEQLRQSIVPGMQAADLQSLACDLFEARGHPTIRSHPGTQDGYVHPLGHGVGLFIHERPNFGATARPEDVIVPGTVFTLEPGLYYPDRGYGVRIEDTFFMSPSGKVEPLAEYSYDLVLPSETSS